MYTHTDFVSYLTGSRSSELNKQPVKKITVFVLWSYWFPIPSNSAQPQKATLSSEELTCVSFCTGEPLLTLTSNRHFVI